MHFCSWQYLLFFAGVFAVYWLLPWARVRVWLLLGASFYFYASWNHWLACLITATSVIDYLAARAMDAIAAPRVRRLLLVSSLLMNLGLLCYFKYVNFFLESLQSALAAAGVSARFRLLDVILPIGISFYTFEAINYTIDVYRRKIRAERSLGHFMLFILFFPHLIAGPIVRAADFLPQVRRRKRWNWFRIHVGLQLIVVGLFKKLAIADHLAQFADPVFADPAAFKSSAVWMAALAYAAQVYCDFSGYTDLALGSAHLLGYRLAVNFNMPYLSANIAEFWRRWHISLSSWLRDYLFIPLGGSRDGEWHTARNLFLTMALGGLWHGASWNFVVWGMYNGLLLIGHRAFRVFAGTRPYLDAALRTAPGTALRVTITFGSVCFGFVIFRAMSLGGLEALIARLFGVVAGKGSPLPGLSLWVLLGVMAIAHAMGATGGWRRWSPRLPAPALACGYVVVLNLALLLAPDAGKTFIYFQF
ncbi:MAG TPA: MBOAT family O-acyltransferase [Gemmataceae bacterium]|jgi:alginate O-acetyltransferase complex protein AlgI|nr:MBOAT family O-acyltransferase [Gemmataceae bacterium]